MFSVYFLVFTLSTKICWSYLVFPFDERLQSTPQNPSYFKDVGEPLILTPYLKSNQTSKARQLSAVKSLLPDKTDIGNAGYFTVDEKYNSNLFFWFFRKSSSDWQKAPLLLWLQGGPGSSSMYGLFDENGPFTVINNKLKKRKSSWNNVYNVIYIDQPVGTGFSFTDSTEGYISTQEEVGNHLFEALTQFFQLYPELKKNAFYVTGESYAGRYIPAIGYKIHSSKKARQTDINLKGLFMISATTAGEYLYDGFSNFCFEIGIIDNRTKTQLEIKEQMLKANISAENWEKAFNLIGEFIMRVKLDSRVYRYDYSKTDYFKENEDYIPFLNDAGTRKKIHVGNAAFNNTSYLVNRNFSNDFAKSVVPWVEELVNYYPVAFVGGQFDTAVAYPTIVKVMENLNWNGASKYKTAVRKIYGGQNVYGYKKTAGNLKDILIRNAGHMVPKDQPEASLDLLNKFVHNEL